MPRVTTETPLFTVLKQFNLCKGHMALVLDAKNNLTILGALTLEDVLEEVFETDIYYKGHIKYLKEIQEENRSSRNLSINTATTETTPLLNTTNASDKE